VFRKLVTHDIHVDVPYYPEALRTWLKRYRKTDGLPDDMRIYDFERLIGKWKIPPDAAGAANLSLDGPRALSLSYAEYRDSWATAKLIGLQKDGYAWVFRRAFYLSSELFKPEDATALLLEAENKIKARVARAHALQDQVARMSQAGRREPIHDDVKVFVWQRDEGVCVRCGSNQNLEFDHIIPLSMGGANSARNLQLLCEGCNRSKGGSLV
jgi:hypothetical protein